MPLRRSAECYDINDRPRSRSRNTVSNTNKYGSGNTFNNCVINLPFAEEHTGRVWPYASAPQWNFYPAEQIIQFEKRSGVNGKTVDPREAVLGVPCAYAPIHMWYPAGQSFQSEERPGVNGAFSAPQSVNNNNNRAEDWSEARESIPASPIADSIKPGAQGGQGSIFNNVAFVLLALLYIMHIIPSSVFRIMFDVLITFKERIDVINLNSFLVSVKGSIELYSYYGIFFVSSSD